MNKMNNLTAYLETLNLTEIEAKLYVTLLESGPISVRELAELVDMKRTTAYLYIDQLINHGLVMKVVKGSHKLVAVVDPEMSIKHLVEEKIESASSLQEEFTDIIKRMHEVLPQEATIGDAEIKFYKGKNGVKKIYEEALKSKTLRSFANIAIMKENLPENSQLWSEGLQNNKDIKVYEIIEDSPTSREQTELQSNTTDNQQYFFRFLPKEVRLTAADTLIYDGKVSIINVRDTVSGVILENADYYNNMRELFDFFWKLLSEKEGKLDEKTP